MRISYPLNTLKTHYITLNSSNHSIPNAITDNNVTILLKSQMPLITSLLNYFSIHIQSAKRFFITPTDSNEVSNITSSNLGTKILKLLNKDISDQLAFLFEKSCSSGLFLSILKTSKIIPIYIKRLKVKCSNYRPVRLLSNIDKILERLMYNRFYSFLEKKKLLYSLQFGFQ